MHTLRPCQIDVAGPAGEDFLLVGQIGSVNSRVGVILTEHGHAGELWERPGRQWGHWHGIGICRKNPIKAAVDFLLLYAVRRDGSHLRQHVLPSIVNAPASTYRGFAVPLNAPGKPNR